MEHNRYCNLIGIVVVLVIAYLLSSNKSKINFRIILSSLALQFTLAFLALKTSFGIAFLGLCARGMNALYQYAGVGIQFLFGNLAIPQAPWGVVFVLQILPTIIFFGAFMSILFYFGIVQKVIGGMNAVIRPIMGTSAPETLCAVANSFLGQTESPLLIKPYLERMTRSEMFVVMVSGMGTMSGSILAVYSSFGVPIQHLLAASVMAVPAAIMIAKIMIPETEKHPHDSEAVIAVEKKGNVFEAIATGTSDGLYLFLNVAAMLLAFVALMSMVNGILSSGMMLINYLFHTAYVPVTLDTIFGYLFLPFSYLLGFCGEQAFAVGQLLGTKVAINEFFAYTNLISMHFDERTLAIVTYALAGFSNFSCIGIQVGGIGALVPSKRTMLTELGFWAVVGGALTNLMTAMVAGLFL